MVRDQPPSAAATPAPSAPGLPRPAPRSVDTILAELRAGELAPGRAVFELVRAELGPAAVIDLLKSAEGREAVVLGAVLLTIDRTAGCAHLTERFRAEDEQTRLGAIESCELSPTRVAVGLLADEIERGSEVVSLRIVGALKMLAKSPELQVEEALSRRIWDHDHPFLTAQALASIGTATSCRELNALAARTDRANGQIAALQAMVALGDRADWNAVVTAIRNGRTPAIRRQASITAGKLRVRSAVPDLIDLLEDEEDPRVLEDIAWGLRAITGESFRADAAVWMRWWESVGQLEDWDRADSPGR